MQAPVAELEDRADRATGRTYTVNRAALYLDAICARPELAGISAAPMLVYSEAARAIIQAATEQHADAIIMATHGRGGLTRLLFGSVADAVLRQARTPVLLVPSTCETAWPDSSQGPQTSTSAATATDAASARPATGASPRFRILVPLDGSALGHEVLSPASDLAHAFAGEIILLRVVQEPPYPHSEAYGTFSWDPAGDVTEARRYLDSVAATLRCRGHTVEVLVEVGSPAAAIGTVAQECQASVIAMATHGRSGLARVVLGSVATATLHHGKVPLLLVRPHVLHVAEEARPHLLREPVGFGSARVTAG
jgi:nucleotide-binding universal stress UspA family protein